MILQVERLRIGFQADMDGAADEDRPRKPQRLRAAGLGLRAAAERGRNRAAINDFLPTSQNDPMAKPDSRARTRSSGPGAARRAFGEITGKAGFEQRRPHGSCKNQKLRFNSGVELA